ncbi:Crp/Fnr family transcriptional regulator [Bradyrhizobium sp. WSM 1704]|uniref:Crp/Fnr family transcriptional regulator n=1 Tax=Bradyrhizobium semiaridum TaxID=2821404 RepID=UPI001CE2E685|nr:Crp/Fnr family transcriptional regulator [Bradyrhizobium semiaridum]MCA6125210.1 Crp/Fnr family transcriptional regulator [Bradyrhizobium semiaridum]
MQAGFPFSRFANRLATLGELSSDHLDLLARMPSSISHCSSRHHLLRRGELSTHCHLLLQGYLCWQDPDGRDGRIISIHVPGDVPDLSTIYDPRIDYDLVTVGPAVVASVPRDFFRELAEQSPSLEHALLLLILADAASSRNWILNVSSRDALERVAHLLCEIATRLRAVGLAKDFRIPSPFTQSELAAACSMSAVHANRTIQELRRSNLLEWHSKTITITNWYGLVRLAGFKPAYLRLPSRDDIEAPRPSTTRSGDAATLAPLR